MFDLEDEFQAKLYDYLKKRSNGSSYIRTLIHSDMTGVKQQIIYEPVIETKEAVKASKSSSMYSD